MKTVRKLYACKSANAMKLLYTRCVLGSFDPRSGVFTPRAKSQVFAIACLNMACVLLLLLWATMPAAAQQTLSPALEKMLSDGIDALKSGDLGTAEKIFSDALQHGVKHPLVYHNLGVIAQQRGDHKAAASSFRQASQLQPDYGPSHLLLGVSLRALGKNVEATRELEVATKLLPKEPQAHLQLAKAYEASDNWIAAVVELQKLVDLAPQEPEYSYQLGKAWTKLSGWSYQRITQLNPASARLQQALGQEYAIQEKYDLALAAYQRAALSDPHLPEVHLARAVILLELKRLDEASAEIDMERKLVPESHAATELKAKIEAAKTSSAP
jgi:Flp pilus assembly protein TadD